MKKILILFMLLFFSSCITTQIKYIEIPPPKHQPLPHSVMPIIEINSEVTVEMLMEHILLLSAAIEKLQVLIEIYEREWTETPKGYSSEKFAGKSLEELKIEYYRLLGIYEEYFKKSTEAPK